MNASSARSTFSGSTDLNWNEANPSGPNTSDSSERAPSYSKLRAGKIVNITSKKAGNLDSAIPEIASPQTASPDVFVRPTRAPQTLLAEWSGYVTSVEDYFFTASLKGIFGEGIRGEAEEDAEIPRSDVGRSDIDLLRPGSYFRLCVFYEHTDTDRPRRYTQVVFRRLPGYRKDELKSAAETATEIHRGLRVG